MILVFTLVAVLWGLGMALKTPVSARWTMIGLLFVAVLALHVALPDGHPLRMATGESPALWLMLGAATGVIVAYRWLLVRIRAQAKKQEATKTPSSPSGPFNDTELNRYARHIVLREIGGAGQRALKDARILVVGAGGLGAPALQYLAAAGIGTIGIVDDDVVENANLQRQVIHTDDRIGMPKVFSAKEFIAAQNPFVTVRPYNRRLTEEIASELFADYDLILDGTDNFETRYLTNRVCVAQGKPLISGALTQWEGQLSLFHPNAHGPCYQCIFPKAPAPELAPNCAEAGVLGPLPGVVGAAMAVEAIKHLTGAGTTLQGQMMIYDALYGENRTIRLKKRADCPICGT